MAVMRWRTGRSVCSYSHILLFGLILVSLGVPARTAAIVHPLDGGGNFHTSVDIINRWVAEDRLDVMVLIEVNNADIKFSEELGGYVGRMQVDVTLESLAGRVVNRKRELKTPVLPANDASSGTLYQVFGMLLKDVPFREGRLSCSVFDANRSKPGLLNYTGKSSASSECATAWAAEQGPRPSSGVALGEPLFLSQAPLDAWNPDGISDQIEQAGWLHDFMHPSRRYGLQEDHLQIFQPVWPQAGGVPADYEPAGLRVEVVNLDMDFALRDTVRFDKRGRMALAAGRPAALFYALDVNLLPEGAYHLSLAPLDGRGRGSLTRFDVVWRLSALGKHRSLVLGEGRLVFAGEELKQFLATSPAEQEKLLSDFWAELNPDPESPFNAAYLEFQYRVAYVQQFLGGFNEFGAVDDRARPFSPNSAGRAVERDRMIVANKPAHNQPFEFWSYDSGGKPLFASWLSDRGMGQRFLFIDHRGIGDYELNSSNVLRPEE